ncbi:MAG: TetR/AcrR family transcriptional regulator [Deltaproteobacteria bacterium]|nr:TetR/AcrR family transcriptional regulator [Deltaproteobacteria bacterium]MCB9789079.1 TetR/AcrR family transcriptional regulator [Deltaproteobacteria bacterium]
MVTAVLEATAEELGAVGYGALRIEAVAQRSGVNKTTIYRRWPTKAELAAAALHELAAFPELEQTGRLREDLIAHFQRARDWFNGPLGRGIARMVQSERGREPELDAIMRAKRVEHRQIRARIVEAGVARGELPPGTDAMLLAEILSASIFSRLVHYGEPVDDGFIAAVVDLILAGAGARGTDQR